MLAMLTACTRPAPPADPDSAMVPLPAATVIERLDAGLRVRGLVLQGPASEPGPIEAVGAGPATRGWADCPTLRLTDPSRRTNRNALAQAGEVTTRVVVSVQPITAGETRVAVRAQHTGSYVNIFTNIAQTGACASTGVLERALLGALAP
jgi:pimeloyl-ACP methyl ester carboxylesterase